MLKIRISYQDKDIESATKVLNAISPVIKGAKIKTSKGEINKKIYIDVRDKS